MIPAYAKTTGTFYLETELNFFFSVDALLFLEHFLALYKIL